MPSEEMRAAAADLVASWPPPSDAELDLVAQVAQSQPRRDTEPATERRAS